jgi:signal transduction histidine kinase/ligand-binding sensor domain-containing protein/DNA-binding response OmpR family regulator
MLLAQPAVFHRYMAADGLSDNNVLCGLRDSYGFMWLGTNNGLNCFDGTQNIIFRNMVEENASFENNTITTLYEHNRDVWFGGSFGLYIYHRNTNTFTRFNKKTKYGVNISSTVQDIVESQNGMIWIATLGQGLFIYDPATDVLVQDSRHGAYICDILAQNDSPMFMATINGDVLLYSQKGNYQFKHTISGYMSDKHKLCLELIGQRLYIGTESGLYTIQRGEKEIVRLPVDGMGIHAMRRKGRDLLLGTDNGIYLYQPNSGQLLRYDNPDDRLNGLSDMKVNSLLWDKDSTLWVMTQMGGVSYMTAPRSDIHTTSLPGSEGLMVRATCEATDGRIWIGSDSGLYSYDRSTQIITPYPALSTEINSLLVDGDNLWLGTTHQGIIVLNTTTGHQHRYQYSPNVSYTIPSNEITSLLRSSQGDIYVGTSWGLCRYEHSTDNFMWYFEIGSMTHVTSLAEDKNGCVWAATSNHGLFQQTAPRQGFRNFTYHSKDPRSIGGNNISTVFCDHSGTVWVCLTGGSIFRFLPESETFERFAPDMSILHEQQAYFIVEDTDHNLWLGMESCLLRINTQREDTNIKTIFSAEDLTRKQKPHNSACITSRGEFFSGRYNLLVHFYPDQIVFSEDYSPVYITQLTQPYKSVDDEDAEKTVHHLSPNDHQISLPYTDNSFTLHFSSPSFKGNNSQQHFEYKLEGIDQTWARGTKNAEATFANVPPGSYTFLLRNANDTDESHYARLSITILPPWYRTMTAFFVYFLLIATFILYMQHRYTMKLRRRYNRQMKEYQTEQEKANFESKIRFFINLVHEIRTPLTLMSLPLEAIEEKIISPTGTREGVKSHLSAIRRNMNYLLGITNQLLDFQKQENGVGISLVLRDTNMNDMLHDICEQFRDAMEVQGKQLQLQLPEKSFTARVDADKLMKVMMNLVGNAMKYAKSEVIVRLEHTDKEFTIFVIDDGLGVPPEEREKIFDRYYQIGKDSVAATLGTGLGLAYAKMLAQAHKGDLQYEDAPGGGSCFKLKAPSYPPKATNAIEEKEEAQGTSFQGIVEPITDATGLSPEAVSEQEKMESTTFRILLVEDNEELLQMTSDAMKPYFRILKARDGVEALDVLKFNEVDVVVSDVMMPRMDGTELCRRIKEDINYSHIPVILLTAKTSIEAKLEGMQNGADIYLEKPFSSKQLYLQIMSLLRMRQQFYERMRSIDGFQSLQEGEGSSLGLNQQDLQFLERLQQMVNENMRDEEFSIDNLAEQMNMSRSSFYRKIKALTDMTPIEYLKTRRLDQAALLLRQGVRITEVAERVGFTSSSYFAKCFRAKFNVLPKDYMASLNNSEQD